MPLAASSKAIEFISNSKNPKVDIIKAVGDLSGVTIKFNWVLVGTYFRPEKTAGGIIRPQTNVGEDEWQGKVGVVLKLGSLAYQDDEDAHFSGERVEIGEWAVYHVGDARSININGYPCRMVRDSSIRMTVEDPNIIF